jgi:tRNA uridine 5-carboxymethylaminomethyl modification enzyme
MFLFLWQSAVSLLVVKNSNNKEGKVTVVYDVIVVGAGHAGCEASLAAARLGLQTLLLTISPDTIAAMSCNPAIGGPAAKSHLVRELDALGGQMGRTIDRSFLNLRQLNETRGPAVLALRAQADKRLYQNEMAIQLARQSNLHLKQGLVTEITVENNKVTGVILKSGRQYLGQAVIVTTGTFLNGQIVMGNISYQGGRQGEPAATELSESLRKNGLQLRRFQTATPPRLSRKSLDFSKLEQQTLQEREWGFSWDGLTNRRPQQPCWVTATTKDTIQVIMDNFETSPIKSGVITTKGPHFCPSIDRKVLNFPEKTDHLIFVEPEGAATDEMYLLGLTTAMPEEVQEKILKTVPGLETAEIIRPGYAIEYDCLDNFQFYPTLESKIITNLYTAGQINGTSGYEEAAVQGLIAGINAARKVLQKPPLIIDRTTSYIGVLIDDLVTKGTEEPYRMMTSLAEFRLFFRLDNALNRLGEIGAQIGLLDEERKAKRATLAKAVLEFQDVVNTTKIKINAPILLKLGIENPKRGYRLREIMLRPELTEEILLAEFPEVKSFPEPVRQKVWHELRLKGYLERQKHQLEAAKQLEGIILPQDLWFEANQALSQTAKDELRKVRPRSLGQALRLNSLNDADRTILGLLFGRLPNKNME